MSRDLAVSIRKKDGVVMIDITGDVTATTGESIEEAYHTVSEDEAKKLVLAFDHESYINSGGIAILIGIAAESRDKDQSIRLTGLSPHFQKIFAMVGLTKYMAIFPSEEAALDGF